MYSTPDSDQRAFREPSPGPRTVIICILSIALMALDNQNDHIASMRKLLTTAVYPVRVLISTPSSVGHWLGESLSTRGTLMEENTALNKRILIQDARLQRLAALEAENSRLRALLDSTAKVGDRVLIAEIMSVDMNPFRHKIVVNKGSNDGVYSGQALIDAQGVIGQVISDQVFSAEALLITDIDHAVPVELLRNQLRTIAVGSGDLERLSLPFLPRNADVIEGDLLVTSGLGGVFPPGYPVGTVVEVTSESGQQFLAISATPTAGLNRIREVLLIWPETRAETSRIVATDEPEGWAETDDTEATQTDPEGAAETDNTEATQTNPAAPAAEAADGAGSTSPETDAPPVPADEESPDGESELPETVATSAEDDG